MSTSGKSFEELPDDVKETTGYWKLKEEGTDRTGWRTGFGGGYGCVVRQNYGMKEGWKELWIPT
jgi:hypothetical protein